MAKPSFIFQLNLHISSQNIVLNPTLYLELSYSEGKVEFLEASVDEAKAAYSEFMHKEEIVMLRKDQEILQWFLGEINNIRERGWTVFKDREDQKIFYKHEEGVRSMNMYLECKIKAPLLNLFCVLGEV